MQQTGFQQGIRFFNKGVEIVNQSKAISEDDMTITERDFEKMPHDFYDSIARGQLDSVTHDPRATAEQWAHNMIDAISGADFADADMHHVGYFMLEDSFHRDTHDEFVNKLGIPNFIDVTAEPRRVYKDNDVSLWQMGHFYDQQDPYSCYGVQYWARSEQSTEN